MRDDSWQRLRAANPVSTDDVADHLDPEAVTALTEEITAMPHIITTHRDADAPTDESATASSSGALGALGTPTTRRRGRGVMAAAAVALAAAGVAGVIIDSSRPDDVARTTSTLPAVDLASFELDASGPLSGPATLVYDVADTRAPALTRITFRVDAAGNVNADAPGIGGEDAPVAFDPYGVPLPTTDADWLAAASDDGWSFRDQRGDLTGAPDCVLHAAESADGGHVVTTRCTSEPVAVPATPVPSSGGDPSAGQVCDDTGCRPMTAEELAAVPAEPTDGTGPADEPTCPGDRVMTERFEVSADGQITRYELGLDDGPARGCTTGTPQGPGSTAAVTMALRSTTPS